MRFAVAALILLASAGCADGNAAAEVDDPSKLSAAMEARAVEIEQRAAEAVAEVEREAAAELASLEQDDAQAADVDNDAPDGKGPDGSAR